VSSWVDGASGSPYDVDNLPYGVFARPGEPARVGVRIGDFVMDAAAVASYGREAMRPGDGPDLTPPWQQSSLNAFLAAGRETWEIARAWLVEVLGNDVHAERTWPHLIPLDEVTLQLPFAVADYVDFYCSEQHATNVGRMFRPDGDALTPNWRHLPIGYHGRAGTVVVSGTDVVRPSGQRKPPHEDTPAFGPTRRLDIEAELGFVVGTPSLQGTPVPATAFADHVFGVTPLNDWSARDIQAWEYVPLGPFLGKSFATSISPWITPLAALETARVPLPGQDPEPLEYLRVEEPAGYDIAFEVLLNGQVVSRPPYAAMYWSPAQMLAHLTVNGASLRTGDLYASGTISGDERDQRGSFLELSWGGKEPFADGRTFLDDGDEVTLRATAPGALGGRIALGEVTGRILPARLA
jgi:fumarylacetoacetase